MSRLATKPGVQSTLILAKADGSIIRSTGLLATSSNGEPGALEDISSNGTALSGNVGASEYNGEANGQMKVKSAEHIAKMVFGFVNGAKDFAEGMDQGDEVKLLRMRTKRNEIVIVPGERSPTS